MTEYHGPAKTVIHDERMKPLFSTEWEKRDWEREQRGLKPLGPFGSAPAEEREVRNEMSANVTVGSFVIYIDPTGRERPALVTNIFGPVENNPSINVVVVNDDEAQTDTYGRKIERFTSVVHHSSQWAHGNKWKPISE